MLIKKLYIKKDDLGELAGKSFVENFCGGHKYDTQGNYISPLVQAIDRNQDNRNGEFHCPLRFF